MCHSDTWHNRNRLEVRLLTMVSIPRGTKEQSASMLNCIGPGMGTAGKGARPPLSSLGTENIGSVFPDKYLAYFSLSNNLEGDPSGPQSNILKEDSLRGTAVSL